MFVFGEKLIEFAVRIGADDLIKDDTLLQQIIVSEKNLGGGAIISPEGVEPVVRERTRFDEFQDRVAAIPRIKDESLEIFKGGIMTAESVLEYLKRSSIAIRHGFPRDSADLPCLSITLGGEDEEQWIGQALTDYDLDQNSRKEQWGAKNKTQYSIAVITTNFEETLVWYLVVKYALLRYRRHLEAYGLHSASVHWGDIEPASEYLQAGAFVYQRTCIFSCEKVDSLMLDPLNYYNEVELNEVKVVE